MAVFKGGPALPKRSEVMSSSDIITSSPTSLSKRKRNPVSALLANHSDEEADDMYYEGAAIKALTMVDGGGVTVPTSDIRSTSSKIKTGDDADDGILPHCAQQTPPKKARSSKSPTKKGSATPKKEEVATPASPSTPGQAPPASAWQAEHWNGLNFAILKVAHDHTSELYDASPSLTPWRVKGRLLNKVRQLMKEANGGEMASKRWDVEQKPNRTKSSPKKQDK